MSKQVDLYTKIKGILEFEAGAKTNPRSQLKQESLDRLCYTGYEGKDH